MGFNLDGDSIIFDGTITCMTDINTGLAKLTLPQYTYDYSPYTYTTTSSDTAPVLYYGDPNVQDTLKKLEARIRELELQLLNPEDDDGL